MKYFVGLTSENKIYCWSIIKTLDLMIEVDTEYNIENNIDQYVVINGIVKYDFEIPISAMVEYEMIPPCPIDETITKRVVYWDGIVDAIETSFKIWIIIIHFRGEERASEYDKKTWTKADKDIIIDNPMNPGELVNELDFFKSMIEAGAPLPSVLMYGIQTADIDGTLNARIYGI